MIYGRRIKVLRFPSEYACTTQRKIWITTVAFYINNKKGSIPFIFNNLIKFSETDNHAFKRMNSFIGKNVV